MEVMPTSSPAFLGNGNNIGSHKRKRTGNAEGAFLSSQLSIHTHTIPAAHEAAALRMNSDAANLSNRQMYANRAPENDANQKRRRYSDAGDAEPRQDTYDSPNNNNLYSRGPLNSILIPQPHTARSSSNPQFGDSTYNTGAHTLPSHTQPGTNTLEELHLPCYICHKKPRYKPELGNFSFCQECGKRACNICIRECLNGSADETARIDSEKLGVDSTITDQSEDRCLDGPWSKEGGGGRSRHKDRICSSCCEERGEDGEVFCLGCVEQLG